MQKLLTEVDVLAISEHWLHANRLEVLNGICDTHHVVARSSNSSAAEFFGSRRGQGGVAIFWRKSIPGFSKVGEIIHDRVCVIRYQPKQGDVHFFLSVYLPAQGSDDDLATVLDEISEVIESREPGSHIILLGDFNGDVGKWGGPRSPRPPTSRGKYVMNFFNRFGYVVMNLQQLASGPLDTFECHNGHSTIDYISVLGYSADLVVDCFVNDWDPLNTSDHRDVHLSIMIPEKTVLNNATSLPGRIKWGKDSVKCQYTENTSHPLAIFWGKLEHSPVTPDSLDDLFQELSYILHRGASDLPRGKYVKHIKPYWSDELSHLKKVKIRAYRAWVGAGRPRDPMNHFMVAYKTSKKDFMHSIRRLAKQYEADEICKAAKLAEELVLATDQTV